MVKHLYKISNWLEARYKAAWQFLSEGGPTGLLHHKRDTRDRIADLGLLEYKQKHETVSVFDGQIFNQNPFNICVFASRCMGASAQQGIRFSVRWDVIVARRKGWLTGDGWSYLRAENDIGHKIGRLPYEHLPDEINGMSWNEYSRISDEEYHRLLQIAQKYKIPEYRKIRSVSAALKALEKGFALFTAVRWYTGNNHLQAPDYILKFNGAYYGGHAIYVTGKENWGAKYENPQTFGKSYGKEGVAYLEHLFGSNNFAIYIEEMLQLDVRYEHAVEFYDGKMVGTLNEPECYVIQGRKKRHVPDMKIYHEVAKVQGRPHYVIKKDVLDKIPLGRTYSS